MAEDFQAGICGDNWWNISSRSVFGGAGGGSPCSMAVFDMLGSYGWPAADVVDMKPRSTSGTIETNSVSDNSMVFQDAQQQTDFMDSTLHMMEFGLSSSSASNWNQSFLCNNGTMLHDIQKDFSAGTEDSTINAFKPISTDDFPVSSSAGNCTETCQGLSVSFPMVSYGYQTTLLNSLLNPEPQQSVYNNGSMPANYEMNSNGFSTSWMNNSLPKLQPSNIHYNNTPLCNVPRKVVNNLRPSLTPSSQTNFLGSNFEEKNKGNSEQVRGVKKIETEPTPPMKRPRIETPSPLPTFKVRKEKLGDRITALQQLVSPFGKTDTASVLQEATEYIKFLHDQVSTLSTPYVKNGACNTQQQKGCEHTEEHEQDLKSRGLCLVPLSSTFPVANETTADFWTPTFGGVPFM